MRTLMIITMLFACCAMAVAQKPAATPIPSGPSAMQSDKLSETTPQLSTEDRLKVRDVQVSRLKRELRMKAMEEAYRKLQDEQEAEAQQIENVVREAAKRVGIDVGRWVFDEDAMKFVPRQQAKQ